MQTSFAEPWSKKNLIPELDTKPKGNAKHVLKVCLGINCGSKKTMAGEKQSELICQELKNRFANRPDIEVSFCYCLGQCLRGNNVVINGNVINFVTIKGLDLILKKHIDRKEELEKAGLTQEDLDTILFQGQI